MDSSKNSKQLNEEPKTVYKYRDWNNNLHRSILIHKKIYLPSPKELNDPFDFQIKLDFNLLDTDEKKNKFIDNSADAYVENNPNAYQDLGIYFEMKNRLKWRLINQLDLVSLEHHNLYLQNYFTHIGVFCASKIWNNILLWSHYANNHSGFCIGFDNKKLRELFEGECTDVKYKKDYPSISPLDWQQLKLEARIKQTFTKSHDWGYEKEYRYIKVWFPKTPQPQDRMCQFDDTHVNEIVLGLNISNNNEIEIRRICDSRNIPVFKIKKSDSQFILERERL